ncbi:MAG: MerR family transcriptional regulator, partial [Jiangellaceae bacterium]
MSESWGSSESSSGLLTIGRFARMCWLSVRALRLYDETGLLHPAYVDPVTNYRYYSGEQAPTARAIAILRSLDMPLSDVRELVNEADPEEIRARLDLHKAALEQRIERDRQMLCRVEDFIRKGAVMSYDIEIREIEPTDVVGVTLKTSPESVGTDAAPVFHQVLDGLAGAGIAPVAPPRMVYH